MQPRKTAWLGSLMLSTGATIPSALAQRTPTPASTVPSNATTSTASTNPNNPVHTLFVPVDVSSNLGASIVSAGHNATVYAIDCMAGASCSIASPVTITEGSSTAVYTKTFDDAEDDTTDDSPATANCQLNGGNPATGVTCVFRSVIGGLGTATSTSTLAADQIWYAPVTITAGQAKLLDAMPKETGSGGESSSKGGAAAMSTGSAWRWPMGVVLAGLAGAI